MTDSITRRELIKRSAAAGAVIWSTSAGVWAQEGSPNEKLNIGIVGVGGRGGANLGAVARTENIAALCDVDEQRLNQAAARFPNAKKYVDFRKLVEQGNLDALVVSTPDHCHAHAGVAGMEMGLHCYCEKPLTHSIYEARRMAKAAKRHKLATQMGNQGHSNNGTRRMVELIQSGVLGDITEAHSWTDRPIWPQGIDRPAGSPPVPSNLHWDLWLGPAPERPYNTGYHPFSWRGWWDFGTGALGDMACHIMDTAFWALKLKAPVTVEAWGEPHKPETAPTSCEVTYEFPQRGELVPLTYKWYERGRKPSVELVEGVELGGNGTILVGSKGTMLLNTYGSSFRLFPESKFESVERPEPYLENSIGHHAEWIANCKKRPRDRVQIGSNFAYAAKLTEMVLLGNVAFRAGHKITWNSKRMRVMNCDEANGFIRRDYRQGWEL